MKTYLDCIPCFLRQALEMARMSSDDPAVHERVVRAVLEWAAQLDMSSPPPVMAMRIHRYLRQLTGTADPYLRVKQQQMALAGRLAAEFEPKINRAPRPFELALRLAIAGNVIDSGINGAVSEQLVRETIQNAIEETLAGEVAELEAAVRRARTILYLADNAGEIVFDRLFIEQLRPAAVTVAVRGGPILNDATLTEAYQARIHEVAAVIDNGLDAPGTILDQVRPEFRAAFEAADLIIAKGQGNFETLHGVARPIWFLFKVKCSVVAAHVGRPVGTFMVLRNATWEPGRATGGVG